MIVKDKTLLGKFRRATACEWCGRRRPCDPHHLWPRGLGGGRRLDVPANLIALCRPCHDDAHAGRIRRNDLVAIVARREGMRQQQIRALVERLRQL